MSIYSVNNVSNNLWQLNSNSESINFSDVFQNLLQSMMSGQDNTENVSDFSQADILSTALNSRSNLNALSIAEFIKSGISSSSVGGGLSNVLSQLAFSNVLKQGTNTYGIGTNEVSDPSGVIPDQPWKPVYPSITSNVSNRNPELYTKVIRQFSVETHRRYEVNKKGTGDTYCNIFMWDVTRAMGAEIPHYYDAKTGVPKEYGDKGANEMTANAIYNWLHKYGDQYGWYKVSPEQAQQMANQGHPVVTAFKNSGGHGHVQVVCPSEDGVYDEKRGVTIAQAGRNLTSYRPITKIYNKSLPKVVYFAHL